MQRMRTFPWLPLLIATAAVGCAVQEPVYVSDVTGECRVSARYFPADVETVEWTGECRNGFAYGNGKLYWTRDGRTGWRNICLRPEWPESGCLTGGGPP